MPRPKIRASAIAVAMAGLLALAFGRGTPHPLSAPTDVSAALDTTTAVPDAVSDVLHRACFDCHSNATRWPWYSQVTLGSWIVTQDVNEGRAQLNFSEWQRYNPFDRADLLDKVCVQVTKKRMPLWPYRLMHREARLTDDDIKAVCAWADHEATRLVQGGS